MESQQISTTDGQEFVAYLDRLLSETSRMMKEGRVPESEGVDSFLDFGHVALDRMRRQVSDAATRGQTSLVADFTMTADEHRQLLSMSESIRNLMEILELRQAVSLQRTEGVDRTSRALFTGTYTD